MVHLPIVRQGISHGIQGDMPPDIPPMLAETGVPLSMDG